MHILLYMLSSLILVLLLALYLAGRKLERLRAEEASELARVTILSWPHVALIVPVAGEDPRIEASLTSLLEQDYPAFTPVFVTESATEPAAALIAKLQARYPQLLHVVAGQAGLCGQKNHNLLAAIAALPKEEIDCYAFCDSTHLAQRGFLTSLIHPIAQGRAVFATGYHEIVPQDQEPITLAYTAPRTTHTSMSKCKAPSAVRLATPLALVPNCSTSPTAQTARPTFATSAPHASIGEPQTI